MSCFRISGLVVLLSVVSFGGSLEPPVDEDAYLGEQRELCQKDGGFFQCSKFRLLAAVDRLFATEEVSMGRHLRLVPTPRSQLVRLMGEPYEFSATQRSSDSQLTRLFKFLSRRAERFVKSRSIELKLSPEITNGGRYQPRFVDEIYSEIDAIEDKNEKPYKRTELKRLLIPLLVVLKLFKLKLLIFLPFIFGLASFKKLLALGAILLPVFLGYFKLCKPDLGLGYGSFGHSSFYHRPPLRTHYYPDEHEPTGHDHG
ncbi:hypothetical protein AAG570_009631 [Ranatra chinensis]|uniref:Uncharacterized protein n=1 Tax=Ranatra chinensis TaxID=642074 RepID=A0ABD0YPQ4_9HEMI